MPTLRERIAAAIYASVKLNATTRTGLHAERPVPQELLAQRITEDVLRELEQIDQEQRKKETSDAKKAAEAKS